MENYGTNRMGGGHKLLQDRLKTEIETLKGISEPCRCGTTRQSYSAVFREERLHKRSDGGLRPDGPRRRSGKCHRHFDGHGAGTGENSLRFPSGYVEMQGAFDGIAGVVCAAEAARLVRESGMPLRRTFQVLGMIGEEGTRFGKALLGSQFIAGIYGEEQLDEFIGINEKNNAPGHDGIRAERRS